MPTPNSQDVTRLLQAWSTGDRAALDQLIPLVSAELRRLAKRHLSNERRGHPLQTTALIHEGFLRLVGASQVRLKTRPDFFAAASHVMRQVLVDLARERHTRKRGGGAKQVSLDEAMIVSSERDEGLLDLDQALRALTEIDPRKSQVVELRFFGGLSAQETAEALHVSVETVHRDWRLAKSWLLRRLRGEKSNDA